MSKTSVMDELDQAVEQGALLMPDGSVGFTKAFMDLVPESARERLADHLTVGLPPKSLDRMGRCHELALNVVMSCPVFYAGSHLVRGLVTQPVFGKRIEHSWIEITTKQGTKMVFDPVLAMFFLGKEFDETYEPSNRTYVSWDVVPALVQGSDRA